MDQEKRNAFDVTVTHRDPLTGVVVRQDPYKLTIKQTEQGRLSLYERPPGSGNLYDAQNKPCGRWKFEDGIKLYDPKAAHIKVEPKETEEQKFARKLREIEAENERLKKQLAEKEIASIRAEGQQKEQTSKPKA